ncbi:putative reverse transcriptase domain-containing protein [Tanacetum coccineum]
MMGNCLTATSDTYFNIVIEAPVANLKPEEGPCYAGSNLLYAYGKIPTTIEGPIFATIEQLIAQRVAEAMAAYKANQNNQNGNGNTNVNAGGVMPVARECTYQDFMKCQPLNFKGTEGVRTIGTNAAYSMTWKALMRLMTEVYCPRNEIQKMETELWNLDVKGNDLTTYTQRFQKLILLCTKMVPEEEDLVEKFIGGLPDNIQGNVIVAEPTRLQDAIRIANNLMDQKLKGYATRNAENKRMFDNNPRDNRVQKPPLKRHNVLKAYTVGNNNKKGYARILPLCEKCKLHHHGPCPVKCGNCKKIGHQERDCWTHTMLTCYGCGGIGHTNRYCPGLRKQNINGEARQNLDIVIVTSHPEISLHSYLN